MPGRPADGISQQMIDCVARLVQNGRRIKDAKLASECGISNGSVHYNRQKVSTRLVPRNLEAKSGFKPRISRSIQCQSRRLSHSSCYRR